MNSQLPDCIVKLASELSSLTDITNEIVSEVIGKSRSF